MHFKVVVKCLLTLVVFTFLLATLLTWLLPETALISRHDNQDNNEQLKLRLKYQISSNEKINEQYAINDLRRIRDSVFDEVKKLNAQRQLLLKQTQNITLVLDKLRQQHISADVQLKAVQKSIALGKLELEELKMNSAPELSLPLPIPIQKRINTAISSCSTMESCFDMSLCSITNPLTINATTHLNIDGSQPARSENACVNIVDWRPGVNINSNTVLVVQNAQDIPQNVRSRALVAAQDYKDVSFRLGLDILLPPDDNKLYSRDNIWMTMRPLSPIRRQYFLSLHNVPESNEASCKQAINATINVLRKILVQNSSYDDKFYFPVLDCQTADCNFDEKYSESMFNLVLPCECGNEICFESSRQVIESLKHGAIPVILGANPERHIPFCADGHIDFGAFAFEAPLSRITELYFMLKSIPALEMLEMKRIGRQFYSHFVGTNDARFSTLIASIRQRLQLLPMPAAQVDMRSAFNSTQYWIAPPKTVKMQPVNDPDNILGPIESTITSPRFQHNFTIMRRHSHLLWNQLEFNLRWSVPSLPFIVLPAPFDAQFTEPTSLGFRAIGAGIGGSGRELSQAIGGDYIREQFTVVILTYERLYTLVQTLQSLDNLPYVNRVIVVCNNAASTQWVKSAHDTTFPQLNVPVHFVTNDINSLNNRFLPNSLIETDAVLSLDDDVFLSHEEIILAFRVWREQRHRLVGLPARFHSYSNGSYFYNSTHTCQLSMVLTGAAFLHQYYFYEYTYNMPSAIRSLVDELMNCEDLAMNFLIAHLTRQAPIKVTSKWTLRCPTCPERLSEDDAHFTKRHKCLNAFVKIYGYNPLVQSQYRADSILFKTRLPPQHQKCFRFV